MSQILPYLLFLACPISMGLMMWWMMRMNRDQASRSATATPAPRIAELESQVAELRSATRKRDPETAEPRA